MADQLIVVAGLPGTGKTQVRNWLSQNLEDYIGYSTVEIQREWGQTQFDTGKTHFAYDEIFRRMERTAGESKGFILESPFSTADFRKRTYDFAAGLGLEVLVVEIACSEREAKRRMMRREKSDGFVSDPRDPRVYDKIAARWEPFEQDYLDPAYAGTSHIRYDSETNQAEELQVNFSLRKITDRVIHLITHQELGIEPLADGKFGRYSMEKSYFQSPA